MKLAKELEATILDRHEVVKSKSRFGSGEGFFIGKREFAHFHNDYEIDIRISKQNIRKLKTKIEEDSRLSVRNTNSDWMEFKFKNSSDLIDAMEFIDIALRANREEV